MAFPLRNWLVIRTRLSRFSSAMECPILSPRDALHATISNTFLSAFFRASRAAARPLARLDVHVNWRFERPLSRGQRSSRVHAFAAFRPRVADPPLRGLWIK